MLEGVFFSLLFLDMKDTQLAFPKQIVTDNFTEVAGFILGKKEKNGNTLEKLDWTS